MKHIKADLSKIEIVDCLYHRTYMTVPYPTLHVTVNGQHKEYHIRKRAASRDKLYHKKGLPSVLVVYDGIVLAYEIIKDGVAASHHNFNRLLDQLEKHTISDDWYFDGEKFYQLTAVPSVDFISIQSVSIIDPVHITYSSSIEPVVNDVLVISHEGNVLVQTSPITGSLESKAERINLLDKMPTNSFVSLSALLTICHYIAKMYDPSEIEKFDITQYMIRHKTVNLAKLPPYVKDNSSTNVMPIEMATYLLGLLYREMEHENCKKLMYCIKMLCRSGIINIKNSLAENVYTDKPVELVEVNFSKYL